ncbi:MAG: AAA family ATPase [Polyangiaceae bacterium]
MTDDWAGRPPIDPYALGPPKTNGIHGAHFPAATKEQLERAAAPGAPALRSLVHYLSADDFFAEESDTNLVVPALGLCSGPPTGIIGQQYSGKTIATFSFGLSVATGKDLWGVWRVKQGAWLHLDYEQGKRHTKRRIRRLARAMGLVDEEMRQLIEKRILRIAVFPELNLTTERAIDHFKREFEGVRLVTCDSLRCMIGSVNENSSEIRDLIRVLTRASDATDAAVGMIHHAGKSPKEGETRSRREMARGSSAIGDEFQSMLVMSKKKGDAVTLVTHEKDRELGHEAGDFGLRIEDVPGGPEGQDPRWGLRVVHVDREEMKEKQLPPDAKFSATLGAARDCIRANPAIAGAEAVAERLGLRAQTVRAAVRQLLADGDVVARPAPRRGVRLYLKHMAPPSNESPPRAKDPGPGGDE